MLVRNHGYGYVVAQCHLPGDLYLHTVGDPGDYKASRPDVLLDLVYSSVQVTDLKSHFVQNLEHRFGIRAIVVDPAI